MEWFCEASHKKLYGRKKRGRPRKKVLDVKDDEDIEIDIEKKPKKKVKRGRRVKKQKKKEKR